MEHDIFISYSRKDSQIVDQFVKQLIAAGFSVWIDREGIYSGDQFPAQLAEAIDSSALVLFFSSASSNASDWTVAEIYYALSEHKTIIPIKIDNAKYDKRIALRLIMVDFIQYQNSDISSATKRLIASVAKHLGKSLSSPPKKSAEKQIEEESGPKEPKEEEKRTPLVVRYKRKSQSPFNSFFNIWGSSGDDVETSVETFNVNGVSFNMIRIDGGTFTMGATPEQRDMAGYNETPTHQVILSDYSIGETPVTQELWHAVMGYNPSKCAGSFHDYLQHPVNKVTWDDCQKFIAKLNELTGKRFRLPTEAEWEFAARGGNYSKGYIYAGGYNPDEVAWFRDNNIKGETHPVATKKRNELSISDMSGNVQEWCNDWYASYDNQPQTNPTGGQRGRERVCRGGSYSAGSNACRVSYRNALPPTNRSETIGFRLAL